MKNIRKILFLLILMINIHTVNAQKPKDFYISYPQPSGTLFHIFPTTFFEHKTNGDLTFDITYQCGKDSAVINFTYYAPQIEPLDSVRFEGKTVLAGKAEKLFIEAENIKKWTHRYSLRVPMKILLRFFNPEGTPKASLYNKSGMKNYDLKRSEWNKKAPIFRTIMKTIQIECEK